MDRSFFKRIAFLFIILLSPIFSFAQEVQQTEGNTQPQPNPEDSSQTYPDNNLDKGISAINFYKISFVDPKWRYLQAYPLIGSKIMKSFYLDKLTKYRKKGTVISRKELTLGKEVAVRYIEDRNLALAEAIFFIGDTIKLEEFDLK